MILGKHWGSTRQLGRPLRAGLEAVGIGLQRWPSSDVAALRRQGVQVLASDLYGHAAEPTLEIKTGVDSPSMTSMSSCCYIVMNQPFMDAEAHVRHALQLLPERMLAVLLRMTWIAAKGRPDLLKHCHTAIIAGRLKMLPPGAQDRGHSGTTDFSWFIMNRKTVNATCLIRGYDCYLRGMAAYYTTNSESLSAARKFHCRAIELDPGFAAAYAMAAYCNVMMVGSAGAKLDQALAAETSRLMSRAVELDRNDATILARAAFVYARLVRDLGMAASYSERAQTLNPNLALAWAVSGWAKVWLGEPEIAIEHFSRAVRLTPLAADAHLGLIGKAHAYFMAERYSEAWSTAATAAQELQSATTCRIAAASAAIAGHREEAAKYMALFLRLDPGRRVSDLADVLGPYKRAEDIERYKRGMRLAGLPE